MRDFTCQQYEKLIRTLLDTGYRFITMEEYFTMHNARCTMHNEDKFVVLRHDVDLKAGHSLRFAQIEHSLGVKATYYFRVIPESNHPDIIRSIAALGHEIGYHYEDMSLANGDVEKAISHFEEWLTYFRQFYPVKTICMHGAPTKKWDGKDLWKTYDYHAYGIIGEPYFDVDYAHLLYLTDTGRRWDGYKVSVRDKIPVYQDQWKQQKWVFRHTEQIIRALSFHTLPNLLITTHPQRWTDQWAGWGKELVAQSAKNLLKRILIVWKF